MPGKLTWLSDELHSECNTAVLQRARGITNQWRAKMRDLYCLNDPEADRITLSASVRGTTSPSSNYTVQATVDMGDQLLLARYCSCPAFAGADSAHDRGYRDSFGYRSFSDDDEIYDYEDILKKSPAEVKEDVNRLWDEFSVTGDEGSALVKDTGDATTTSKGLLSLTRLFSGRTQKVKIAFLNEKTSETSSWTYSHELGRLYLEETYPNNVETFHIDNLEEGESAEKAIESAIQLGSDIIFTTSPCLIKSSVRAAVAHPNVIILNCSLNQFYHSLRTYYGRMYEAKFLMGAIAAAMSQTDHIGYLADYPIYGTIANINAFAMGAKMINPRAMIHLEWSRINHWSGRHLSEMEEVQVISGQDMIRPDAPSREFGIYKKGKDGIENIASPMWHWGKFYEQIVQNVLDGTWKKTKTAMNYWLGLSSDVIDIVYSNNLPVGTRRLLKFLEASIIKGTLEPFYGVLYSQDGIVQKSEDESMTPEQIVTMDWLADNVLGVIPTFSDLTDEARELVLLQGPLNTEE